MPQPKKSGSSASQAGGAASPRHGSRPPRRALARGPRPSRRRARGVRGRRRRARRARASGDAEQREDQLLAAIASLRDLLSKGIVITSDRLQETVDEAVKRGRMTRPGRRGARPEPRRDRPPPDAGRARRARGPRRALGQGDPPPGARAGQERRRRRAPGARHRPRPAHRRPRAPRRRPRAGVSDHRLRGADDGAGQGAPRRPQPRRAAQGPRPRAPQREPQVGADGDRAQAAVGRRRHGRHAVGRPTTLPAA